MRKRIITFVLVLMACFMIPANAFAAQDTQRLFDGADLLTETEESRLINSLDSISQMYKVDIIIVTVDTVGDYTSDEYIEYYYDENNCGYGENHDGVLLLVTMWEREYRILSNGLGADAISSGDIEYIGEVISYYLSEGDYEEAFRRFISECEYEIDGEINGFPFNFGTNLFISLAIGVTVALIVTGVMKSELKSRKMQLAATEYTRPGSMKVTTANDLFLYRTMNRYKKESSSSGSRSSSRRNVGGGKF